jgi:hypothetical protein
MLPIGCLPRKTLTYIRKMLLINALTILTSFFRAGAGEENGIPRRQ